MGLASPVSTRCGWRSSWLFIRPAGGSPASSSGEPNGGGVIFKPNKVIEWTVFAVHESAFGPKRTSLLAPHMSGFGGTIVYAVASGSALISARTMAVPAKAECGRTARRIYNECLHGR